MGKHIVVDNSNIIGGAYRAQEYFEKGVPWAALRLSLENLFQLIESGDVVLTKSFVTGDSGTADAVWKRARNNGYDTYLLTRVELQNGKQAEQAVDEVIHLVIANNILDHEAPQTLVIASGDGKISDYGTSFISQAERALRHGWTVEVWSWSATMTGSYQPLVQKYGDRVKLYNLDDHYRSVTWLLAGKFHHGDGVLIDVAGREADPISSHGPSDDDERNSN